MKRFTKYIIIVCSFLSLATNAQLKNIGNKAKKTPNDKYLLSVYGHLDFLRGIGGGVQYRFMPQLTLDIGAYKLFQNNISFFQGYGFSFKPKYWFPKLGYWYIGPNISYEKVYRDKTWVINGENHEGQVDYLLYLQDFSGNLFTVGVSGGAKLNIRHVFIEPFAGFGISKFKGYTITYEIDDTHFSGHKPSTVLPNKDKYSQNFFQLNLGLKVGIDFIKNKHREKLFDFFEQYTPRIDSLTINITDTLLGAKKDYINRKLNKAAIHSYRRHYYNIEKIKKKMEDLFLQIEKLVN